MENRMADLVQLFKILNAKGIADGSAEMDHISKVINNEFDFGYRSGAYAATGIMSERDYGTGRHKP